MTATLDGVDSGFMDDTDDTHDTDNEYVTGDPSEVDQSARSLSTPQRRSRKPREPRYPAAPTGLQLNPREAKMLVAELRTLVKSIDAADEDLVAQTRGEFLGWVAEQAEKLHEKH